MEYFRTASTKTAHYPHQGHTNQYLSKLASANNMTRVYFDLLHSA